MQAIIIRGCDAGLKLREAQSLCAPAMEIEMRGEPAHEWRRDGGVEKQVGRSKIEAGAHQPLQRKARQLAHQYSFGGRAEMQEMVCNGLRRPTAELKGQANPSSGRGRDH